MDILIDVFKTFFSDAIVLLEESLKNINKLLVLITDIFYIKNTANKIFKLLDLEKIPIKFYLYKTNCYFNHSDIGDKAEIGFGLAMFSKKDLLDNIFDNIDYKFNNRRDKLFFVVSHEISHYLQWAYYKEWYYKNSEIYKSSLAFCRSPKSYRKIKLEGVADKLAIGIYKRLKRKEVPNG